DKTGDTTKLENLPGRLHFAGKANAAPRGPPGNSFDPNRNTTLIRIRNCSMSTSHTALLVVDVQESFRHRPYWCDAGVPFFIKQLQALIDGAKSRRIPVVQIFP